MQQITKKTVMGAQRLSFLVGKLGNLFIPFEQRTYNTADLYTEYDGGYWEFYELSNGGFFMAPDNDRTYHFQNADNYSDVNLSSEALGIVACLYALSLMSFEYSTVGDYFHQLRDFVMDHPESAAIFEAIN